MKNKKVYCAGPLFNPKEREEMKEIATCFENAGYDTFLPQRDGFEMNVWLKRVIDKGIDAEEAGRAITRAVFALDVYQLVECCDGILVNLNGRVPDEGSIAEAAIAWCADKPITGYKNDNRTVFMGEDNPLVTGLFDFEIIDSIDGAVEHLKRQLEQNGHVQIKRKSKKMKDYIAIGRSIWEKINSGLEITDTLVKLVNEAEASQKKNGNVAIAV